MLTHVNLSVGTFSAWKICRDRINKHPCIIKVFQKACAKAACCEPQINFGGCVTQLEEFEHTALEAVSTCTHVLENPHCGNCGSTGQDTSKIPLP